MAIKRINDMDNQKISQLLENLSWSHLRNANRASLESFQLQLADKERVLFCKEIIRVIPKKRIVAFGTFEGEAIVAKLFYEPRHAKRHMKREYEGVQALQDRGVLTPPLLFKGTSKDKKIQVLIFKRIQDAQCLQELWQNRKSIKDVLPLMHALTVEIATFHVLGILQRDLHLKNFLVNNKGIFAIDGGHLEIYDYPLPKKASIENLALFFSQLGIGTEELQKKLFQIYSKARGWLVKKHDEIYLWESVERWTQKRWEDYSKKITRTCTEFVRRENTNTLTVYDRNFESQALIDFIKNPESIFASDQIEILKKGNSSTVVKTIFENRIFVLKRYNIKNAAHWLRRCFRPTRAATGWRLAQRLRLMGIATARPVAFVEKKFLGFRGKSYLLMEYVGKEHVGEFFAKNADDKNVTEYVAQQMMALFENLARLRITHGDLKMTNILVSQYKPVLIDLDGMHEHRSLKGFKRAFQQELNRFMVNWKNTPTVYNMFQLLVDEVYRKFNMN